MRTAFGGGFDGGEDARSGPAFSQPQRFRIEPCRFERPVVRTEISHGGRVEAGIFSLQCAAVQRFSIGSAAPDFEDDGRAVPGAILADFVSVQTSSMKRAVPLSEEPGLQAGERGPAKFIAT